MTSKPVPMAPAGVGAPSGSRLADRVFHLLCLAGALTVGLLLLLVLWELIKGSHLSMKTFGWKFFISKTWDPNAGVDGAYGALPFIYGTIVTSIIALVIAVPLSIGTAIYLTDLAPMWLRQPLTSIIEMLAAVPSVIWGLWGIFVLVPVLRTDVYPVLQKILGFLPFFKGPILGVGLLTAGTIVAIMILPIVTSVSREVLRSVPNLQREAAYALGATRWEVTRIAVLSYARRGLMGAAVLGLGRALGETMAVTMVIGNAPNISLSLFDSGDTLASVIANQFPEASGVMLSSLFELGLVLLGVTILVNILAQIMIHALTTAETRRVA
ncbi:MAG TPA: phosphate ABC transporter permease subunit PstC [Candidatus Polarisedimenticolia bacterium]|nr:phosphate ABC transporter permease subunit PstC [Candidatus Polarisedimenticolia bacterium]